MTPAQVRRLQTSGHIPENWHQHVIIIWQEDDAARAAHDATREHLGPSVWSGDVGEPGGSQQGAWARITGTRWDQHALRHHDDGDTTYRLYVGGWVRASSYDGSALGIALEVAT